MMSTDQGVDKKNDVDAVVTYPRDLDNVRQDCRSFLRSVGANRLIGDPIRELINFLAGSFDCRALFFNPTSFQHFA